MLMCSSVLLVLCAVRGTKGENIFKIFCLKTHVYSSHETHSTDRGRTDNPAVACEPGNLWRVLGLGQVRQVPLPHMPLGKEDLRRKPHNLRIP